MAICSAIIQVMELAQMFLTEEVQVPVEAVVEQILSEAATLALDQDLDQAQVQDLEVILEVPEDKINEDTMICQKCGVVPATHQCRRFRYDPLKRVPPVPKTEDFSRFEKKDYSL